jgi:hypothetical protein
MPFLLSFAGFSSFLSKYGDGRRCLIMKDIDVSEIAKRLFDLHQPFALEEIEKLVDEKFNGKSIPLENLGSEILMMVAELIGKIQAQNYKFMIDLVQSVVDELQKPE